MENVGSIPNALDNITDALTHDLLMFSTQACFRRTHCNDVLLEVVAVFKEFGAGPLRLPAVDKLGRILDFCRAVRVVDARIIKR